MSEAQLIHVFKEVIHDYALWIILLVFIHAVISG